MAANSLHIGAHNDTGVHGALEINLIGAANLYGATSTTLGPTIVGRTSDWKRELGQFDCIAIARREAVNAARNTLIAPTLLPSTRVMARRCGHKSIHHTVRYTELSPIPNYRRRRHCGGRHVAVLTRMGR
jgi:hypothetical protein